VSGIVTASGLLLIPRRALAQEPIGGKIKQACGTTAMIYEHPEFAADGGGIFRVINRGDCDMRVKKNATVLAGGDVLATPAQAHDYFVALVAGDKISVDCQRGKTCRGEWKRWIDSPVVPESFKAFSNDKATTSIGCTLDLDIFINGSPWPVQVTYEIKNDGDCRFRVRFVQREIPDRSTAHHQPAVG